MGDEVVAGETGSSLGPGSFVKGQSVVVSVVADDGEGTGEGVSEPVVIANTAPGAPGVEVTPVDAVEGDALVCSVVMAAVDPDVDDGVDALSYSFAWTVDDVAFAGAADSALSSEVPGEEVGVEELWACSLVASDGDEVGPAGETDVFVESGREAGDASTTQSLGTVRYIPAGSFTMGCVDPRDVAGGLTSCNSTELPSRTVTLTTAFWMMETELTQGMWAGLGFALNPSYFGPSGAASSYNPGSADHPVELVNWWEALEAANEASRRDDLAECYALTGCSTATTGLGALGGGCTGTSPSCTSGTYTCTGVSITAPSGHPKDCAGWRLPTEVEWEYAARAGTTLPFSGGSDAGEVAWISDNNGSSGTSTHGTKAVCTTPTARNGWGLCDMSGNVREWTWDWYASNYDGAATTDPTGPASGSTRVYRGGDWSNSAQFVRVANRASNSPGARNYSRGLRLVRSVP